VLKQKADKIKEIKLRSYNCRYNCSLWRLFTAVSNMQDSFIAASVTSPVSLHSVTASFR